jgi:hypothetical protein
LKKQATVETATFGSEFIAARTTIDQIVNLWTTLCYLGVPIQEKSYVFGDNKWQDLHDDDKTCMQSSYWELVLENGQWLGCWTTDELCALPVTGWTGIHGFGYLSPLIWIAPFSAHKLIEQDTAVLHQAIIV